MHARATVDKCDKKQPKQAIRMQSPVVQAHPRACDLLWLSHHDDNNILQCTVHADYASVKLLLASFRTFIGSS